MRGCLGTADFLIVSVTESGALRAADRINSGSDGVRRRRCRVLPHNHPAYAYSLGPLDTPKSGARRASSSAQSQCRCRSRASVSCTTLASSPPPRPHRPHGRGGGPRRRRVTPDRLPHFDSPRPPAGGARLVGAGAPDGAGSARRACTRPQQGATRVRRRQRPLPGTLGAQGRAALATGSGPLDVRAIIQGTYVTARRAAITELVDNEKAGRLLPPGRPNGRSLPHGL